MKKSKLLLITLLTLLLTSCSINYELIYEDQKFKETINGVNISDQDFINQYTSREEFKEQKFYTDIDKNREYHVNFNEEDKNNSTLELSTFYDDENIKKSNVLNSCFQFSNYLDKDNIITYTASGLFTCLYAADNIDIVLKTNHQVLHHNADEYKLGDKYNSYIWHINQDIVDKKEIIFQISKEKNDMKAVFDVINYWHIAIIIAFIVLIILLIYVYKTKF